MPIEPDDTAFEIAAVVGLAAIEDQYGDDAYGEDDDRIEKQTDLGENA